MIDIRPCILDILLCICCRGTVLPLKSSPFLMRKRILSLRLRGYFNPYYLTCNGTLTEYFFVTEIRLNFHLL